MTIDEPATTPRRRITGARALTALAVVLVVAVVGSVWLAMSMLRTVAARPEAALRALDAGDGLAFRDAMTGSAAQATTADLLALGKQLNTRFGAFVRLDQPRTLPTDAPKAADHGDRMEAVYDAVFEHQTVPVRFLMEAPEGSWYGLLDARIRRITVTPADGARIVFPFGDDAKPVPTR